MDKMKSSLQLFTELFGAEPSRDLVGQDVVKFSNTYFEMYIKKKNVLFIVDKRDRSKKRIYANLSTAIHHLGMSS